jgi:hypothetical protein
MNAGLKLAAYAIVLVAMFAAGAAVGAIAGPDGDDDPKDTRCAFEAAMPAGLASSFDDYTLTIATRQIDHGEPAEFRFAIVGPDGEAVRDVEVSHERALHLVIVGRNLTDYVHVHPEQSSDDTWTVVLPAMNAGSYRVFADFVPAGGERITLASDLTVLGEVSAGALPAPSSATSIDGYDVTFDGLLESGTESELTVTVERDGAPVTDIEPYLGALGHLVAIRDGDMAYLHVHPVEEADGPGGPIVTFMVDTATPGDYRLFFEFDHGGAVHAAATTLTASNSDCPRASTPLGTEADHGHGG